MRKKHKREIPVIEWLAPIPLLALFVAVILPLLLI